MSDSFPNSSPRSQDDLGYWYDPRWSLNYVYDPDALAWVPETQPGGGGGGGGAVTIADGADVAQGTTTDPAWSSGSGTVVGILKAIAVFLAGGLGRTWTLSGGTDSVGVSNFPATQPISGSVSVSNFPATQPISGTVTVIDSVPLAVSGTVAVSNAGQQLSAASIPVVISSDQSPIPITGSISATSAATATADSPSYTEGVSSALSQDLSGNLRTIAYGTVDDSPQNYVSGTVQTLSLTPEGRVRVATVPARESPSPFSPELDKLWGNLVPDYGFSGSPWSAW